MIEKCEITLRKKSFPDNHRHQTHLTEVITHDISVLKISYKAASLSSIEVACFNPPPLSNNLLFVSRKLLPLSFLHNYSLKNRIYHVSRVKIFPLPLLFLVFSRQNENKFVRISKPRRQVRSTVTRSNGWRRRRAKRERGERERKGGRKESKFSSSNGQAAVRRSCGTSRDTGRPHCSCGNKRIRLMARRLFAV